MTFTDLLNLTVHSNPAHQQHWAAAQFPNVVRQSQMELWQPEEDVVKGEQGIWIAVATYVLIELELLDALEAKLASARCKERIYLFDLAAAPDFKDFEKYIPGIGKVYQTPVIASWTEGIITEKLTGFSAREWLVQRFHLARRLMEMNVMKNNSQRKLAGTCLVVALALSVTSCFFSTKAIYFEKEQQVAEEATKQFHELHNRQDFQGIYNLLDEQPRSSAETPGQIKANFENLGRVLERRLVEKKVFNSPRPEYSSQVKLAYEIRSEKGNWTELFAWNIKGSSKALLAEYRVDPTPPPSSGNR